MLNTDNVDLLRLIGGRLKQASRVTGEHYRSCPKCGGEDRFRIFPATNRRQGRFWCRQCNWSGDAIEFVMWRDDVGFVEALDRLGIEGETEALIVEKPKPLPLRNLDLDSYGFSKDFPQSALDFLYNRGISREIAADYLLYDSSGLGGRIAIVCKAKGKIPYIKLRAVDPSDKYKYLSVPSDVPGRKTAIYSIGCLEADVGIIVESELDALVLETCRRRMGKECALYALGGVTQNFDMRDDLVLAHGRNMFSVFDNDVAGQKCTEKWGFKALHLEAGCKDIGDLYQARGYEGVEALLNEAFEIARR